MRKYNRGDVVLCKKYSVESRMIQDLSGFKFEPYIDDSYFNRKAYISGTYKEIMEEKFGKGDYTDKDEYQITFLDNNSTLAWVDGDDLILLMRR